MSFVSVLSLTEQVTGETNAFVSNYEFIALERSVTLILNHVYQRNPKIQRTSYILNCS
jgi:hypothetical protein